MKRSIPQLALACLNASKLVSVCPFLSLVALLLGGFGCARRVIAVSPSHVPTLAQYSSRATLIAREPQQDPIVIRPEMEPELVLGARQPCPGMERSKGPLTCESMVRGSLRDLKREDGAVIFALNEPPSCILPHSIELRSIERAVLAIGDAGIPLPASALPRVLSYGATHSLTLEHGGRKYDVTPSSRPILHLYLNEGCRAIPECENGHVVEPLEILTLRDGVIRFCDGTRDIVAKPGDILHAWVYLRNAPPFRPRFGVGFDAAGPAMVLSLTGQWYPAEWMVFEAGLLPWCGEAMCAEWVGQRFRIRMNDSLLWSFGGFASMLGRAGPDGPNRTLFSMGPRWGVEYVLGSQRDVLRVEVDAVHGNLLTGDNFRWFPWGGIAYTTLF